MILFKAYLLQHSLLSQAPAPLGFVSAQLGKKGSNVSTYYFRVLVHYSLVLQNILHLLHAMQACLL